MVQADSQRRRSSRIFSASMSVVAGFSIACALAVASGVRKHCEAVDGVENRRDSGPLVLTELGPPDIEQQNDPRFAAVVPGLMLDAVVEDQQLAFVPGPRLVADAQPAAVGHDQR